jgi:small GTP-binding protein
MPDQIAVKRPEYDYLFKIVLTGDCNAGKSHIMHYFLTGEFKEVPPTIGVEFTNKIIEMTDGKRVNMQLWDTAGSEKFRSITKHYYRGALGVILVYDITNLKSFLNLKYWLQQVRAIVDEECIIALMANKLDIMFTAAEQRQVMREQAELFARENQLLFIDESSALAGINVDETFYALAEGIKRTQLTLVNRGEKPLQSLRLKEEGTSMEYDVRNRCCY